MVGAIAAVASVPKWWDLSTAAVLVQPDLADVERGTWTVDASGRLTRTGPGEVLVARSLDGAGLTAAFSAAFG